MGQFNLTRHSRSDYDEYEKVLVSADPHSAFDHRGQEMMDLSEEGMELAKKSAKNFLEKMNSKKDRLFFVSSNEARAITTADIYRREAEERGFEVINQVKIGSKLAEKIGERKIRVLHTLSLNPKDLLLFHVYTSSPRQIDWTKESPDFAAKWREAREIVESDNKGAWGANFLAHGERIGAIFAEVETPERYAKTKLKSLFRLMKWAAQKMTEDGYGNIKIMAFGHEDYLVKFLLEVFEEQGIKNCETITFDFDQQTKSIAASYRGKVKELVNGLKEFDNGA